MSTTGYNLAILFTGHMIDAPGRQAVRFPASAEEAARVAIRRSVESVVAGKNAEQTTIGVAGGASGGDLLFHETCAGLRIPTLLRLALPVDAYIEASVGPAGAVWVERFRALFRRLGPDAVSILNNSVVLPESLTEGAELNIWQRTNLWMIREAIALAPQRSLIALWDGKPGDGPGGTEHLVEVAPKFGIEVAPIVRTQSLVSHGYSLQWAEEKKADSLRE